MSMVKQQYGGRARYLDEIARPLLIHSPRDGGVTGILIGAKGAGKTNALIDLAHSMRYKAHDRSTIRKETVIWRGRDIDYWPRMDPERRRIWIYTDDRDRISWHGEQGQQIAAPGIQTYSSVPNLLDQIRLAGDGTVNVVYSPCSIWDMSKGFMDRSGIGQRGYAIVAVRDREIDLESFFWYEVFHCLIHHAPGNWFCTLIVDEVQRILPPQPKGRRWALQEYIALDILPDFRKRNKTLLLSAHGSGNIDYRIYPLIQAWGYMRGSRPRPGSLVKRNYCAVLDPGHIIWDAGLYAECMASLYPLLPPVRAERIYPPLPEVMDLRAEIRKKAYRKATGTSPSAS